MTIGTVRLSEGQLYAFVADRLDGAGPCRLNEDLPAADIAATSVVPNARILMAELDGGGAKLTVKGNLNRKLVESLVDRFRWLGMDGGRIREVCKVINECDYIPAMYLHAVLTLAGLARKEKGLLRLTRKGRSLLPEEAGGRLQAMLLRTTFTRYNPAYLDGYVMPEVFGPQISLILYLIGQFWTDWRPAEELMAAVTFPTDEITASPYPGMAVSAFRGRVLRYLCWFGLMEEAAAAANDDWSQPRLYRKTSLYDRMLRFAP